MKKLFIICIAFTFWMCAKNAPYTPPTTQRTLDDISFGLVGAFEVVTWNLENYPKLFNTTVGNVQRAMVAISADVYALQEIVSNSYFNQLVDEMNSADSINLWAGYRANDAPYDQNLAFIYKPNDVAINDIYEIYQNDWYAFPRSPLVVDLTWNDSRILVVNNHLKASGGSANEDRRRDASEKLQEYIDIHFAGDNVVVVGDWNDEIQEPQTTNVFWNFIDDTDHYKFTDMDIAQDPTRQSWSYPAWPSHLDHILITVALYDEFSLTASQIKTIRVDDYMDGGYSEYNNTTSDHRPVGIRLKFE